MRAPSEPSELQRGLSSAPEADNDGGGATTDSTSQSINPVAGSRPPGMPAGKFYKSPERLARDERRRKARASNMRSKQMRGCASLLGGLLLLLVVKLFYCFLFQPSDASGDNGCLSGKLFMW
eukprot:COSAG01_NODE_13775_length_1537_cov_2.120306_2_plen_122_part_00